MEKRHRAGPAELTWDAERRLGVLRFVEPGVGDRECADALIAALEGWVDEEDGGYRFLVDCADIADADAGWRMAWARFFQAEADDAVVAWFNATPRIKLIILMFKTGTGIDGAVFATEEEARAWLDTQTPRLSSG